MAIEERVHQLLYSNEDREEICEMVARLEEKNEQMRKLILEMLMVVNNAQRGFSVHPKTYRDFYSRTKNLGIEVR